MGHPSELRNAPAAEEACDKPENHDMAGSCEPENHAMAGSCSPAVCWGKWGAHRTWGKVLHGHTAPHPTLRAASWPFSWGLLSNTDVSGLIERSDQIQYLELKPTLEKDQNSAQGREHEVRVQESSSVCVGLERSLLWPHWGTVNKAAKIYLLWETTGWTNFAK